MSRGLAMEYIRRDALRVTLLDVPERRCARCGHREVRFCAMGALRDAIAWAVASKPTRLGAGELRALRLAAWSLSDFARAVGVGPAVAAEWERDDGGVAHDARVELILRLLTLRRLGETRATIAGLAAAYERPCVSSVLQARFVVAPPRAGWELEAVEAEPRGSPA
jgi:hypothetical protein